MAPFPTCNSHPKRMRQCPVGLVGGKDRKGAAALHPAQLSRHRYIAATTLVLPSAFLPGP